MSIKPKPKTQVKRKLEFPTLAERLGMAEELITLKDILRLQTKYCKNYSLTRQLVELGPLPGSEPRMASRGRFLEPGTSRAGSG